MPKSKYHEVMKGKKRIETPSAHKNVTGTSQIKSDGHFEQEMSSESLRDLEDAREALFQKIIEYKDLLKSKVLMSNRTDMERQRISELTQEINTAAFDLDGKNFGEGTLTLNAAALNSIVLLHGQINELRFHLHDAKKTIEELQAQQGGKEEDE